jgi:hypothetical protein
MAQADVLTPAGEVRTRQGTFPNTGSPDPAAAPDVKTRTVRGFVRSPLLCGASIVA